VTNSFFGEGMEALGQYT